MTHLVITGTKMLAWEWAAALMLALGAAAAEVAMEQPLLIIADQTSQEQEEQGVWAQV
jgi:hypothetical protein